MQTLGAATHRQAKKSYAEMYNLRKSQELPPGAVTMALEAAAQGQGQGDQGQQGVEGPGAGPEGLDPLQVNDLPLDTAALTMATPPATMGKVRRELGYTVSQAGAGVYRIIGRCWGIPDHRRVLGCITGSLVWSGCDGRTWGSSSRVGG